MKSLNNNERAQLSQKYQPSMIKRGVRQTRNNALYKLQISFPGIISMDIPISFSTANLGTLSQYIQYNIPVSFFPPGILKFYIQLNNYYYDRVFNDNNLSIMSEISSIQQNSSLLQIQSQNDEEGLRKQGLLSEITTSSLSLLPGQQEKSQDMPEKILQTKSYQSQQNLQNKIQQTILCEKNKEPQIVVKSKVEIQKLLESLKTVHIQEKKENVSKKIIQDLQIVNGWKFKEAIVELPKQNRPNNRLFKKVNTNTIITPGSGFELKFSNKSALEHAMKKNSEVATPTKTISNTISIGHLVPESTKKARQQIEKQAQSSFATMRQQQVSMLDQFQKGKIQINYVLNQLSPQNLQYVVKILQNYFTNSSSLSVQPQLHEKYMNYIIEKIISKCQTEHHTYIPLYAEVCYQYTLISKKKFSFSSPNQHKSNPFKVNLVALLQKSFDSKFDLSHNMSADLHEIRGKFKNNLVGCILFIFELLKKNVLCKRIINVCLATFLLNLIDNINKEKFAKTNSYRQMIQNYIETYLDAMVKFMNKMRSSPSLYSYLQDSNVQIEHTRTIMLLEIIITSPSTLPYNDRELFLPITLFNLNDYLEVMKIINDNSYKNLRETTRIDLLLQNLTKGLQQDAKIPKQQRIQRQAQIEKQQSKQQQQLKSLEVEPIQEFIKQQNLIKKYIPQVKAILQDENKTATITTLQKLFAYNDSEKMLKLRCLLRLLADDKKQVVFRNLNIFIEVLQSFNNPQEWLQPLALAWGSQFEFLSTQACDFKYLTQCLAELLFVVTKNQESFLDKYYINSNDEDEMQFMQEIMRKFKSKKQ